MTPREWIASVRAAGLIVELNESRTARSMPVLVYLPEGAKVGNVWRKHAPSMVAIGIDAIADELRRERLH